MDRKIIAAHIEIGHRKLNGTQQKHNGRQEYELEKKFRDSYQSQKKENDRQEQELKLRKRQENLAYMKFWERQIEEKKLLRDLDRLQEKQLKERINKFNEMKQRTMPDKHLTRQAVVYKPLMEMNIGHALQRALHEEQIRVRAETTKREAEDNRWKQEKEIRAARNKKLSNYALQLVEAKQSKSKRQLLKEKQEAWEKASGWAPKYPVGARMPVAPRTERRTPVRPTCTHTHRRPSPDTDDFDTFFKLHILCAYY